MAYRRVEFDVQDLVALITHYTEGRVPLGAEVQSVGVSKFLPRWIQIVLRSKEWDAEELPGGYLQPYHFRYEGKKTLSWTDRHEECLWDYAVEAPKPQ